MNSALQRARRAVDRRVPDTTQRAELEALGAAGRRELVDAFLTAWERADLPALLALLADDATFSMPPPPAWFDGREAVGRFFAQRVFATPWRLVPLRANGQQGFACYLREPGADRLRLGAINVLTLRAGRVAAIIGSSTPRCTVARGCPMSLRATVSLNGETTTEEPHMRKLIVANIVSLDGYYEGPGGNVMVLPMDESFDAYNAERLRAADTLLLGGTSYEGFKGYWPPVADDPGAKPVERKISRLNPVRSAPVRRDPPVLAVGVDEPDVAQAPRADAASALTSSALALVACPMSFSAPPGLSQTCPMMARHDPGAR